MRLRAVSPRLFGREAQLGALRQQFLQMDAGKGGLALVAGAAGVGKSRLLGDALQLPEATRFPQVWVTCLEGDEQEPYSLARQLITVSGGDPMVMLAERAPEAERQVRQAQRALQILFDAVRDDRPLIVVIEDVHWSDGPSLQALLALALNAGPVLLLLSYRPEPLSTGLAGFLAEVQRLRLADPLLLQPLSTADTARMVRAMLGLQATLPSGLLHEVTTIAEGIPFLIEELLHSFVKQGRLKREKDSWRFERNTALAVPDVLRHAVEARLLQQRREVIAVAEQAAVLGQVVGAQLLARLSGLEEEALFSALRALVDAQLLVMQDEGAVGFRHALTREAIRTRLMGAERRTLHRRVALLLEAEGIGTAATLAFHWREAGEVERAARHAYEAARQAAAVHAHREAITHYELALAGGAAKREEILTALGDHYQALGEIKVAITHYRQAQSAYKEMDEATAVAVLDLRIGESYAQQRERTEALQSLQAAFKALPEGHGERWRAGLYLGLQQAAGGRHEEAAETFRAAQSAAGDDRLAQLRVTYELSGLKARRGAWAALEAAAQSVLSEAPEDSDEGLALRHDAHAALGSVAYYRGELRVTLAQFTACLHIAEQRGLLNDRALARWNLATNALYHLGRWHEAREHLSGIQALGVEELVAVAITFEQWLDGAWEAAAARWLEVWPEMEASEDLELQMAFGRRIADVLLALARYEEALTLLTPLMERLREREAKSYLLQLIPRQVEALARVEDNEALAVAQQGLDLARALGGRPAEGLLLRGRAMARQEAGQWLDAFAGYEAAVGILEALPMPYEVARTQREAGLARLARGRRGDRDRAAALLRRARDRFADLGARRDESAMEAILSSAGLTGERERAAGPLTAREREVAELVAQGLSNGEIGERLYITEKTAAYHVGNILNKLNFNSRVEIAVYIAQQE